MHYEEHPTWRMLEEGKQYFKFLEETTISAELASTAREAMRALYSLQLEVENQLTNQEDEGEQ
jgi:hypothetical protein